MIKKKISLFLAALMVSTIVIGSNVKSVYAAEGIELSTVKSSDNLKDGEYTVNNVTTYVDENNTTGQEMARNVVLEDSTIKVQNGVIKMTVKFNSSMYSFLKNINVTLDGQVLPSEINEAEQSITFEIPSIDSKVLMNMNVSVMKKDVSFYMENNLDTLTLVKEAVNNTGNNLTDGNYVLTNDVEYYKEGATASEIQHGYSSARGVLADETKVTVKDGKITMTLSFNEKMYSYLENIKVSLNGTDLNGINDSEARTISFDVPSVDSKVLLSMGITAMKNDVSFYVLNDFSTLREVKDESSSNQNNAGNNTAKDESVVNGGNTSVGNVVEEAAGVPEETNVTKQVTIREYKVQNNVVHESATGVAMARKYLNSTSYVKEADGKYYITLSFTGREFMNNHKVYVNGNLVNTTVVSSDSDNISLRFQVSSLNDNIKVSTYVVPMGRNVEFGVQILTDTLTLIKEYTVAPEEVEKELTVPSTGDFASTALSILGLAASGAGAVLTRKRR